MIYYVYQCAVCISRVPVCSVHVTCTSVQWACHVYQCVCVSSFQRISSAVHFDIDDVSDHTSPLPHMLPTVQGFQQGQQMNTMMVIKL